jgi:lysophospholipase L1-like esterase
MVGLELAADSRCFVAASNPWQVHGQGWNNGGRLDVREKVMKARIWLTLVLGLFLVAGGTGCGEGEPRGPTEEHSDDGDAGYEPAYEPPTGDDGGVVTDDGSDGGDPLEPADDGGIDPDETDDDITHPAYGNIKLHINIGDSLAAGYNADNENDEGGRGFARLVYENHSAYPAYAYHDLKALNSDTILVDISKSGGTSAEALCFLKAAMNGALSAAATCFDYIDDIWKHNNKLKDVSVDGDVLVTLTCGGNDFNDDIDTMLERPQTEVAAAALRENYIEMVSMLREQYENNGHQVIFLMTNVHDPTGGTGSIPSEWSSSEEKQCKLLTNPLFGPSQRADAIANLAYFNQEMRDVIDEVGGYFVDNNALFLDHGMNAEGSDRWISDDCIHPTNEGHHQLRREQWFVLTGERY